jgi:5-methylcytosine-specific restriction endonuclease McrA
MSPHRIVPWQHAAFLFVQNKIDVLESYDEVIRSPSIEFLLPSVARLKRPVAAFKKGVKFSRINVMTRDHFTCQYCGRQLAMKELNYDHVVPRIQGGKTVWENIVTSCYPCNDRKAGRTPEQAGMRLLKQPYRPKTLPMTSPLWPLNRVPEAWIPYLDPTAALIATG